LAFVEHRRSQRALPMPAAPAPFGLEPPTSGGDNDDQPDHDARRPAPIMALVRSSADRP
jgi:hypothetical protein